MKSILFILAMALGVASTSHAEEFTLTRGDGKVFTCSDQGGGPISATVPLCKCTNQYDSIYGQVFGTDLLTACKSVGGNRVAQCTKIVGDIATIACKCTNQYDTNYGTVIGANAIADCKAAGGNRITSCASL